MGVIIGFFIFVQVLIWLGEASERGSSGTSNYYSSNNSTKKIEDQKPMSREKLIYLPEYIKEHREAEYLLKKFNVNYEMKPSQHSILVKDDDIIKAIKALRNKVNINL